MEPYAKSASMRDVIKFVETEMGFGISWDYLEQVRDQWQGPLVLKGILNPADAERALEAGVDGIQVSNHGARQLDAVPAAIDQLPAIVRQVDGRASIIFDSGARSGLDIARALALGADFVMLGRAFVYGVAALGARGADHAVEILLQELKNNMAQLGCSTLEELRESVTEGTS
jgi:L-lactate dehydrogenase (cytochrome)